MTRTTHSDEPAMIVKGLTRLVSCHDLPAHLPDDPLRLLAAWYEDARRCGLYDDFNAMTLATTTPDGYPSARIVLCKTIEPERPALVFYTSYASRKGRELESNPRAAAVFHWPHAKRQARIEGDVERTSGEESDAYFRTRPLLSRIGASVSPQSQSIESRAHLVAEAIRIGRCAALGTEVQRPEHWGGYRVIPRRIELWSGRSGRLHDRAVWEREAMAENAPWMSRRLGA